METQILTTKDVADLLQVSRVQVHRLRRDAGLPAMKFGRSVRFNRDEVMEWLETHREAPTSDS